MTDPRLVVLILGTILLIIGSIVSEVMAWYRNPIRNYTPTVITKGGNMTTAPGWTAIPLDIVASPTTLDTLDDHLAEIEWDDRLTRAIRKLHDEDGVAIYLKAAIDGLHVDRQVSGAWTIDGRDFTEVYRGTTKLGSYYSYSVRPTTRKRFAPYVGAALVRYQMGRREAQCGGAWYECDEGRLLPYPPFTLDMLGDD